MTAETRPDLPAPATSSAVGLADPQSRLEKVLAVVPRALSSHAHILLLFALGVYLIVLPLLHVYTPGPVQMLIGGNYTNVTSDIGACIAAGGTLHLVRQGRSAKRGQILHRMEIERLRTEHAGELAAIRAGIASLHRKIDGQ